jgi:hypothetical protein
MNHRRSGRHWIPATGGGFCRMLCWHFFGFEYLLVIYLSVNGQFVPWPTDNEAPLLFRTAQRRDWHRAGKRSRDKCEFSVVVAVQATLSPVPAAQQCGCSDRFPPMLKRPVGAHRLSCRVMVGPSPGSAAVRLYYVSLNNTRSIHPPMLKSHPTVPNLMNN